MIGHHVEKVDRWYQGGMERKQLEVSDWDGP